MCKYCEYNEDELNYIVDAPLGTDLMGNNVNIIVELANNKGILTAGIINECTCECNTKEIPINYCPMCGRKLKGGE